MKVYCLISLLRRPLYVCHVESGCQDLHQGTSTLQATPTWCGTEGGAGTRRPVHVQVSEEDILEAERVAQETRQAMRNILKGIILILPALPFPQPPQGCAAPDCCLRLSKSARVPEAQKNATAILNIMLQSIICYCSESPCLGL